MDWIHEHLYADGNISSPISRHTIAARSRPKSVDYHDAIVFILLGVKHKSILRQRFSIRRLRVVKFVPKVVSGHSEVG